MYPILCYTRRQKGQYNKLMYSSASRDNTYLDVCIHLYIGHIYMQYLEVNNSNMKYYVYSPNLLRLCPYICVQDFICSMPEITNGNLLHYFPLNNGHKSMSCFPRIKHQSLVRKLQQYDKESQTILVYICKSSAIQTVNIASNYQITYNRTHNSIL